MFGASRIRKSSACPCLLEKHADSKIDCRSAMMLSADASPAVGKSYEIAKPPVEQLTKRKRGRPPGSKNKKLESVEPPKPRRGRPPGSKNKPKEFFLSSVNRSSWYPWPTLARSEPTRTAS